MHKRIFGAALLLIGLLTFQPQASAQDITITNPSGCDLKVKVGWGEPGTCGLINTTIVNVPATPVGGPITTVTVGASPSGAHAVAAQTKLVGAPDIVNRRVAGCGTSSGAWITSSCGTFADVVLTGGANATLVFFP